jgi:hypothetical protein
MCSTPRLHYLTIFLAKPFHLELTMGGPATFSGTRRQTRQLAGIGFVLALMIFPASHLNAQQETPAEILALSNNPLAPLNGLNFNEYYAPSLYDATGVASTFNVQGVLIPLRRHFDLFHIVRVSLPVASVPTGSGTSVSGLGDLVIQDAFRLSKMSARTQVGVGPLLVVPTATSAALGSGKWQAGVAGVLVIGLEGGSVVAGAVTWQISFAGDASRANTNLATFQPTIALALGQSGFYLSSSPIWVLDFANGRYLIPFSIGIGKVLQVGKTIVNVAAEPQFTVFHTGAGQPALQLFAGLTLQWKKEHRPKQKAGS